MQEERRGTLGNCSRPSVPRRVSERAVLAVKTPLILRVEKETEKRKTTEIYDTKRTTCCRGNLLRWALGGRYLSLTTDSASPCGVLCPLLLVTISFRDAHHFFFFIYGMGRFHTHTYVRTSIPGKTFATGRPLSSKMWERIFKSPLLR